MARVESYASTDDAKLVSKDGRSTLIEASLYSSAEPNAIVFPRSFLQSIGIGGAVVTLTAAATSLLLLPALFVLLGARLGAVKPAPVGSGVWYRLAAVVVRRPEIIASATIAVLLALAIPTLQTKWSAVNASVLPSSQSAHVVAAAISRESPTENSAVVIRQAAQFHDQHAAIANWWSPAPLRRLHRWLNVGDKPRTRPTTPSSQGVPVAAPHAA